MNNGFINVDTRDVANDSPIVPKFLIVALTVLENTPLQAMRAQPCLGLRPRSPISSWREPASRIPRIHRVSYFPSLQ